MNHASNVTGTLCPLGMEGLSAIPGVTVFGPADPDKQTAEDVHVTLRAIEKLVKA